MLILNTKKNNMRSNLLIVKLLCPLLLLFPLISEAQVATTDVLINQKYYLVTLEKIEGIYTIKFKYDDQEKSNASTPNFNPAFINKQLRELYCLSLDSTNANCSPNDQITKDLKLKSTQLFLDLIYTYANENNDKGQKIADITLSKSIPTSENVFLYKVPKNAKDSNRIESFTEFEVDGKTFKTNDSNIKLYTKTRLLRKELQFAKIHSEIIPEKCEIVFENGFIASIIVSSSIDGKKVRFSSQYGIGITTRTNITDFSQIKLYDELGNTNAYIKLNDVINYERINEVFTRDHSPMDGKVLLSKAGASEAVYKSSKSKLFRLNIYSDFVGINENNPNGLVQVEIDKRINLWTKRVAKRSYFTFLSPYFEWSKIEEHNRTLLFSKLNETSYVSPLEVYRFSMIETGLALNLFEGDGAVFNFQLNLIPALTFTQIQDSLNSDSAGVAINERINSFVFGSEFKFTFSPETSWSMSLSTRPFLYSNLNSAIPYNSLEETVDKQELKKANKVLNDISLNITIRLGENHDNLFFARMGFIHEINNTSNNFAQVQLGYSTYLKTPN